MSSTSIAYDVTSIYVFDSDNAQLKAVPMVFDVDTTGIAVAVLVVLRTVSGRKGIYLGVGRCICAFSYTFRSVSYFLYAGCFRFKDLTTKYLAGTTGKI